MIFDQVDLLDTAGNEEVNERNKNIPFLCLPCASGFFSFLLRINQVFVRNVKLFFKNQYPMMRQLSISSGSAFLLVYSITDSQSLGKNSVIQLSLGFQLC